jgi:hypothetical protein
MDAEEFGRRFNVRMQLKTRVPGREVAQLPEYRLAFNWTAGKAGPAGSGNLVKDPQSTVHGVVYDVGDIDPKDFSLWKDSQAITVVVEVGDRHLDAVTFVATQEAADDTRLPARDYKQALIRAGQDLSPSYVATLQAWPTVEDFDARTPWVSRAPSSAASEALRYADLLREQAKRKRIHMEHLIAGLFHEEGSPTRRLLEKLGDENAVHTFLARAAEVQPEGPTPA